MNLVIDAGNTAVKLAVFDQDQLISQQVFPYNQILSELEKAVQFLSGHFLFVAFCSGSLVRFLEVPHQAQKAHSKEWAFLFRAP